MKEECAHLIVDIWHIEVLLDFSLVFLGPALACICIYLAFKIPAACLRQELRPIRRSGMQRILLLWLFRSYLYIGTLRAGLFQCSEAPIALFMYIPLHRAKKFPPISCQTTLLPPAVQASLNHTVFRSYIYSHGRPTYTLPSWAPACNTGSRVLSHRPAYSH